MADEHWGEAERTRRHVRRILEQLGRGQREQRITNMAAPLNASESIGVKVEREENHAVGIGDLKPPA